MPYSSGARAKMSVARMRAMGLHPSRCAAAADINTAATAPSVMPEALPAVTVPSGLKAGGSLASFSRVVSARGYSSAAIGSLPFSFEGRGSSMRSVKPVATACAACCWLRRA